MTPLPKRHILAAIITSLIALMPRGACGLEAIDHYEQAISEIGKLASSKHVRFLPFGKSAMGKDIPAYVVSDFSSDHAHNARVLVISGQHGDEYSSMRAAIAISKRLAGKEFSSELSNVAVIFVPVANPDGVAAETRETGTKRDLNRSWEKTDTPEAKFVDNIIKEWRPHIICDLHEWTSPVDLPMTSIELAAVDNDKQHIASGNLANIMATNASLKIIRCTKSCNSTLLHRHYSKKGHAAFLIETDCYSSFEEKKHTYEAAVLTAITAASEKTVDLQAVSPSAATFTAENVEKYWHTHRTSDEVPFHSTFFLIAAIPGICYLLIAGRKKKNVPQAKPRSWNVKAHTEDGPVLGHSRRTNDKIRIHRTEEVPKKTMHRL